MKVRLKVNRVANRHRQRRGDVIDVTPAEAKVLIASHRAEPVDVTDKPKAKEQAK